MYTDSIMKCDVADSGEAIEGQQPIEMAVPGRGPRTIPGVVAAWPPVAILGRPMAYQQRFRECYICVLQ